MSFIYLIIYNENKKKKISNSKYSINRYSILLKDNNIPLLRISNNNILYEDLILFYLKNFIELDSIPSIKIKIYKKYKNIIYLFIETDNFIKNEINSKYTWKHYLDLIDDSKNSIFDSEIDFNINNNQIYNSKFVTFQNIVKWHKMA